MLPKRFLFRFATACCYKEDLWSDEEGAQLDESYRIIDPTRLETLSEQYTDFRIAWNETGLAVSLCVIGKQETPWCRATQPEDSEGLQLWIDTRDVHNVHRASRFCHRFLLMPMGSGPRLDQPVIHWLPINRSREQPNTIPEGAIKAWSVRFSDGYQVDAMIPARALTGYDPEQYPRLGFNYSVRDRELGDYVFSAPGPMPYQQDPSLWATLDLCRD